MNFTNIYKDYILTDDGTLAKTRMESKHLMYRPPYQGTPAVDAHNVWEQFKGRINLLQFTVYFKDGSIQQFTITKAMFEEKKQVIDFGFGVQYAVPKEHWTIETVKGRQQ